MLPEREFWEENPAEILAFFPCDNSFPNRSFVYVEKPWEGFVGENELQKLKSRRQQERRLIAERREKNRIHRTTSPANPYDAIHFYRYYSKHIESQLISQKLTRAKEKLLRDLESIQTVQSRRADKRPCFKIYCTLHSLCARGRWLKEKPWSQ